MLGIRFWLLFQSRPWLVWLTLVVAAVLPLGWLVLDEVLARTYRSLQPGLEANYSQLLGRPVQLGPYGGLGWTGIHFGPSQVLPSALDSTQLAADGFLVSVDLWASLQQRRWVIHLHLQDLKGDWRRNGQGEFWTTVPKREAGEENSNLVELWLHTRGPAVFRFWWQPGADEDSPADAMGTFLGQATFGHARHNMVFKGQLDLGSGGQLSLASHGIPLSATWSLNGTARALQLANFNALVAESPAQGVSAQVDGAMAWQTSPAQGNSCSGSLVLKDLELPLQEMDLAPGVPLGALRFDPLRVHCDGHGLQLTPGDFHLHGLMGQVQGSLGLDLQLDLQAHLSGPIPPPLALLKGTLTADLQLLGSLTAPESQIHLTAGHWDMPSDTGLLSRSPPDLVLHLASQWRPVGEHPQLWGSLQLQAGQSHLAMAGQLSPTLQLQSSTMGWQPGDWLAPGLWPTEPYTGSLAVAQTENGPEILLQLRNPQVEEDLVLQLEGENLQINGNLELAAGDHLGLTGEATGGQWQLEANLGVINLDRLLDGVPALPLVGPHLSGVATAEGRYGDTMALDEARLTVKLPHGLSTPDGPLLGETQLHLETTSHQQLALRVEAPQLESHGVVDWWPGRSWQEAGLDLSLALKDFPMASLRPLQGKLHLTGQLRGFLSQPRFDGELALAGAGWSLVRSPKHWSGKILSLPNGDHSLHMAAGGQNSLPAGAETTMDVHITSPFQLRDLQLRAGHGHLEVLTTDDGYRWVAHELPLSWLQSGVPQDQDGQPQMMDLGGVLHGEGSFSLNSPQTRGTVVVHQPRWGALLHGRSLHLELTQKDEQLQLDGELLTNPSGRLTGAVQVNQQAGNQKSWWVDGHLDGLPLEVLYQSVAVIQELHQGTQTQVGSSRDLGALGDLVIGAVEKSLDARLDHLAMAQEHLRTLQERLRQTNGQQLNDLQGQVHGAVHLHGGVDEPVWALVKADLHLWLGEGQVNHAIATHYEPLHFHLEGPLGGAGTGTFYLSGLPLKLLNVLAGLPLTWQGSLGGRGEYEDLLGQRLVTMTLELERGQFHGHTIQLEPASLALVGTTMGVDLALQTTADTPLLIAKGQVDLAGGADALQLRLSAGEEIMVVFLSSLSQSQDTILWTQGDVQTTLILRGSFEEPQFYGYLRLQEAEGQVAGIPIRNLNSVVAFDLNRLLVEELEATIGEAEGQIRGSGSLGWRQPSTTDSPLTVELRDLDISTPAAELVVSGELVAQGSVEDLELGGHLQLSHGVIRAGGNGETNGSATNPGSNHGAGVQAAIGWEGEDPVEDLLRRWTWQDPLELADLGGASPLELSLLQSLEQLPPISLKGLRVVLGPELALEASAVSRFTLAGQVRLTGPMGPDLQPLGLVEFSQGYINLFTSRFRLDPGTRNVAIFTPSSGLIPYLDVTLWTQESDGGQGQSSGIASVSAADITGITTAFDRLNLVRIQAVVQGPADNFPAILRLQSRPSRSQDRLVALIGGNAVNRLIQGSTGSRLFSAFGQTLLDPVLARLAHSLGQRTIFSISPTSFAPATASKSEQQSSAFVLAGELGLTVTDRLDISVVGALNRNDLPPQSRLNIQLNPALAVEVTVDRDGHSKGVLQFSSRF